MKRIIYFILSAIVCLSLFSCTKKDTSDDISESDIAGADWRTWGIITDYGTIVTDGDEAKLCVCVHDEETTIYYDTEEQTVFCTLEYPYAVSKENYKNMTFGDINGDGNGDVSITFSSDTDGEDITFSWIYDENGAFYFLEE